VESLKKSYRRVGPLSIAFDPAGVDCNVPIFSSNNLQERVVDNPVWISGSKTGERRQSTGSTKFDPLGKAAFDGERPGSV
jgi:hypothetical protein